MDFARRMYSKGWVPDMDEVNGPEDGLLRGDNLILDELGVLASRPGSSKINGGAFSDTDIHSLFTVIRDGTKYRYAGASNAVYRNGTSIAGVNGSGDVAFGSFLGQTFFARGNTRKKDDGSTVRYWGIGMTGGAPTVQAALASRTKTIADWNIAETASHTITEDDGTGLSYSQDHNGVNNQALVLFGSPGSNRGVATKTFGSDQDFNVYTGPVAAADDDIFSSWVFILDTSVVKRVTLLIDVNGGSFQNDYYYTTFEVANEETPAGTGGAGTTPNDPGGGDITDNPPLI